MPVVDPPPKGRISSGTGQFNNPDNIYDHVRLTTMRGNLVVSAQAPTYQEDSLTPVNDLSRPASESPQVRYWSLCVVLKDLHTGACLREQRDPLSYGKQPLHAHRVAELSRRQIRQLIRCRSRAVAGIAVVEIPPAKRRFSSPGVPRSLCVDGELRGAAWGDVTMASLRIGAIEARSMPRSVYPVSRVDLFPT